MKHAIPDAVLAQHTAILGKTGSGKTSTEKLGVEQVVAAGFRVCVLDTIKSDWWGITSSADGTKPGLPFKILGGAHGHVALHSSAGKAIGQLVGSGKLPLSIIDMADFEPGGIQRFFVDFAQALMKAAKGVLYLVIEEAHEVAPKERAGFGAENLAIHYAKKLATAGRSKGIRLIVATQRVQSLHNAVLGSCDTLIAHRLTTPADQEPVVKWLKANVTKEQAAEVAASLSSLPTGEGFICSGEAKIFERVAFPKFKTFDNNATPERDDDNEAGAEFVPRSAPVDQDELRAIIGDAVKEAEANDPKRLRAEIARLKAESQKPAAAPSGFRTDPRLIDEARQAGITEGRAAAVAGIARLAVEMEASVGRAEQACADVRRVLGSFATFTGAMAEHIAPKASATAAAPPARIAPPRPAAAARSRPSNGHDATVSLGAGERRVLTAIAQTGSAGISREGLTVMTGYKRSSRNTYMQRLSSAGLIETRGDYLLSTAAGDAALGPDFEPLPTGNALREHWLRELPEGERRLFEQIVAAYPDAADRAIIGERAGYKRSSTNTYIQRLTSRDLVVATSAGVVASEALFG